MFTLTYLNIVTIILDVSAIILVLGILRQTRFMRQSGRESDRLFRSMLIFTCVMAVGDIGGYLSMDQEDAILIGLQNISMTVFYIALTMLVMLWFDYCSFRFRDREQVVKIGVRPAFIPGVLVLGIVFINNSTGLFFRIDEMGHYHREILFLPVYAVYAVYLIAGFVYVVEGASDVIQILYFKITRRIARRTDPEATGKRLFKMAPIHHHFEKSGWSEERICFVFAAVNLLCGILACVLVYYGLPIGI